jgi:hypothetical protein
LLQKEELGQLAVCEGDQQAVDADLKRQGSHGGSASDGGQDPRDRRASFTTACDSHSAACWTSDINNPIPSCVWGPGGTSEQVGFLGERRRHANINSTAAFRTILSSLGATSRKGCYASSRHAL